jgi:hypothetical protein
MNDDERSQTARRQRIRAISQNIQELSAQLNRLIIEESQEQEQIQTERRPQPQVTQQQQEFAVNDRVVITNSYGGLRGATGTVVHVTPRQVSIRVDGHRRIYQKRKSNVRKLRENEQL